MESIENMLDMFCLSWEAKGIMKLGKESQEWISNFIPIVTCYEEDIASEQGLFSMDVYIAGDSEPVHKDGIRVQEIKKIDWTNDINGKCYLAKYKGSIIEQIIQWQLNSMECRPVIDKMGWQFYKGNWIYCLGSDVIGDTSVKVSQRLAQMFDKDQKSEKETDEKTICKTVIKMLNCCGENGYSTFLTLLYSILRKIFEYAGIEKTFVLYIYGGTASFKTSLARYYSSWGPGIKNKSILSLESTHSAREAELTEFSDCVCVLDDLAPTENKSTERKRDDQIGSIIRTVVNYTERKKRSGNKTVSFAVDASLVVTAEQLLDVESIMNRCWLLSTQKYPLNKKFLDFMKEHPDLVSAFLPFFIDWVIHNRECICNTIQSEWERIQIKDEDFESTNPRIFETRKIFHLLHIILRGYVDYILPGSLTKELEKTMSSYLHHTYCDNIDTIRKIHAAGKNRSVEQRVLDELLQIINKDELKIGGRYIPYIKDNYEEGKYTYIQSNLLLQALIQKPGLESLKINKLSKILKDRHLISPEGKELQVKRHKKYFYKINTNVLESELDNARLKEII